MDRSRIVAILVAEVPLGYGRTVDIPIPQPPGRRAAALALCGGRRALLLGIVSARVPSLT